MNKAIGGSWKDIRKEIFTPEEIVGSDLRVALVGELIKARKEMGITQKRLEGQTAGDRKNGKRYGQPEPRYHLESAGFARKDALHWRYK